MNFSRKPSIDLGLAVMRAVTPGDVRFTLDEIADVCGCTKGGVFMIQQRALQKLRKRAFLRNDPVLRELFDGLMARDRANVFPADMGRPSDWRRR